MMGIHTPIHRQFSLRFDRTLSAAKISANWSEVESKVKKVSLVVATVFEVLRGSSVRNREKVQVPTLL